MSWKPNWETLRRSWDWINVVTLNPEITGWCQCRLCSNSRISLTPVKKLASRWNSVLPRLVMLDNRKSWDVCKKDDVHDYYEQLFLSGTMMICFG